MSFLSRKDDERLRGRLQVAEQQICGKKAGLAFKELSKRVKKGGNIGFGTLCCLYAIADGSCFTWILYVDASNDDSRAGIGVISERAHT